MGRAPEPTVEVTSEVRIEVRIVCKNFGKYGHAEHSWVKERPSLAKRYLEKRDDELAGTRFAAEEIPHRLQVRAVTDWEDWKYPEHVEHLAEEVDDADSVDVE